jgi:hypothetical protein
VPTPHWKPGQSGNPKGRPKGAKDRLSEFFLRDLVADWKAHGREALKAARESEPATYCLMVARLMPKDVTLQVNASQALLDALKAISEPALTLEHDEPAVPLLGGPAGHA